MNPEQQLVNMLEEVLAYTAPELLVWKIVEKLKSTDLFIYNGTIHEIIEAGFVDGNDESDAYEVYTVPED